MRLHSTFQTFLGTLLFSIALNGFAQTSGAKPPAPKPSRAPIGAPPAANSDEINNAYEFRNRMSSDPICQELARQSDSAYADEKLKPEDKQQSLEQLRRRASAAGCI